jgi:hypothetical protein
MDADYANLMSAGVIGACCPELIRLARLFFWRRQTGWSWTYLGGSVILIIVSLGAVILLAPDTWFSAFYTGLGTPALISGTLRAGMGGGKPGVELRSGDAAAKRSPVRSFFSAF